MQRPVSDACFVINRSFDKAEALHGDSPFIRPLEEASSTIKQSEIGLNTLSNNLTLLNEIDFYGKTNLEANINPHNWIFYKKTIV